MMPIILRRCTKVNAFFAPRGWSRGQASVGAGVAILRRHLLDEVPVSDLCEELGLQPTVFYGWQKEFFENGASAFQAKERPTRS